MPQSPDRSRDRRRPQSPSGSPEPEHGRRRHHRDEDDSRRRDEHRSSRRDSSRRRSSRSPSSRKSHRRDYEDRPRERRERTDASDDDRRRRRHRSPDERQHRRHRDRDSNDDDKERSSRRHRTKSRSRSPRRRRSRSPSSREVARSRGPLPSQQDAYTSSDVTRQGDVAAPPPEKEKPNFGNTGRLAAESNTVTVNGGSVVLKYHEPPEARKPPAKEPWRLYVFKGQDLLEVVEIYERSCWLIGRERLVVDFPLDHPSCSKQHAALQFRYVEKRNEFGDRIGRVKPYLIDLESANGSSVNGDKIPGGRYVELRDKDVLQFGLSSREYVLMLPKPE
ncbi:SMAD/FHA domain-containing protein [Aspergillus floccosus]